MIASRSLICIFCLRVDNGGGGRVRSRWQSRETKAAALAGSGTCQYCALEGGEEVESGKCYFSFSAGFLMAARHLHNH